MESNAKPLFGHYENIICPECKSVELVYVRDSEGNYIHVCGNCKSCLIGIIKNDNKSTET
jgi:phage FluMu protein Com